MQNWNQIEENLGSLSDHASKWQFEGGRFNATEKSRDHLGSDLNSKGVP